MAFWHKKLDYVYISLVKKISSNLIGIPVLQPCEHNLFCRFLLFFVRRSVYGRRVFCHFGGVFYCIFKHTSDINMRIPFISQDSSIFVGDDRKKNIEILKRIIKIYAFPYVRFAGRADRRTHTHKLRTEKR